MSAVGRVCEHMRATSVRAYLTFTGEGVQTGRVRIWGGSIDPTADPAAS